MALVCVQSQSFWGSITTRNTLCTISWDTRTWPSKLCQVRLPTSHHKCWSRDKGKRGKAPEHTRAFLRHCGSFWRRLIVEVSVLLLLVCIRHRLCSFNSSCTACWENPPRAWRHIQRGPDECLPAVGDPEDSLRGTSWASKFCVSETVVSHFSKSRTRLASQSQNTAVASMMS